ncbi:MAG: hypothetical protein A2887_04750 [Alphaproteobacteria bacterium RIFCSPLOWO2_01_FULL_40_26]|nr:MAG: hypothetical protein A3D15_03875 [Alphaproteobacteria bacterium RIFCSPHIGHO2_02_FULL_40_34]OFW88415.1 MAG: hypothetical protein A2794_01895 [Alphaproteobacteria bacterium RIFCSPHIGHO2_01_FULL_40_8]OFW94369.1 MAG: hypothetical protein A2887_04750 [Alphaproteobacteria bacterium RIFCSPLOWO2_01_FULL_40_26]OFX09483.1 MAG: hypothetical protein A3H30_02205 [Alphaproteobacteria bacterium RIFCSPLOWO2_02_FULL_40_19]OFX12122.1 MAG: hypothetical protein A3G22_00105 [Alphaproteobacteria bacterium RI
MSEQFEIISYKDDSGKDYFSQWVNSLDWPMKRIVFRRINRVRSGNFGDHKSVGDRVYELRLDVGPGYRIYFSKEKNYVILLLCAGNKSSQRKDIEKAKTFLRRFHDKKQN